MPLLSLPPLALYVHLPWCIRKCPYCDFNSHERGGALPEDEYIGAADAPISRWPCQRRRAGRCSSIFIGGGTPSLFSGAAIARLLEWDPAQRIAVAPQAEITLEANPGTAEAAKFQAFAQPASRGSRWASRASTRRSSGRWGASTMTARRIAPWISRWQVSNASTSTSCTVCQARPRWQPWPMRAPPSPPA